MLKNAWIEKIENLEEKNRRLREDLERYLEIYRDATIRAPEGYKDYWMGKTSGLELAIQVLKKEVIK